MFRGGDQTDTAAAVGKQNPACSLWPLSCTVTIPRATGHNAKREPTAHVAFSCAPMLLSSHQARLQCCQPKMLSVFSLPGLPAVPDLTPCCSLASWGARQRCLVSSASLTQGKTQSWSARAEILETAAIWLQEVKTWRVYSWLDRFGLKTPCLAAECCWRLEGQVPHPEGHERGRDCRLQNPEGKESEKQEHNPGLRESRVRDFGLFTGLLVRVSLDKVEKYPKPAGKQMSLRSLRRARRRIWGTTGWSGSPPSLEWEQLILDIISRHVKNKKIITV